MNARSLTVILASLLLSGCDALFGGLPPEDEVFDAPIDGLTEAQLATFLAGDEAFGEIFSAETGLGPIFNAPSCDDCHPGEGRGHPGVNLVRFGRGDAADASAFDYLVELGGPQLQDRAIPGYEPETLPPQVAISERGGPVAVGLGLLEATPAETILALADPDDLDGDGISGRANFVLPPDFIEVPEDCDCAGCKLTPQGCKLLGRFGRKATAVNLLQQTVGAYHDDMGITSDFNPVDLFNPLVGGPSGDVVPDPEVAAETVHNVVFYLRTLRPPPRRNLDDGRVARGAQVFADIGCAACHVPALPTGPSHIEPLSHVTAFAYTDMLLHDMGPALADGFPEGEATGNEWRTTPLWGLGIVDDHLGGVGFFLHDGRAATMSEAIGYHGGEAQASRDAFVGLDAVRRDELLTFLDSL